MNEYVVKELNTFSYLPIEYGFMFKNIYKIQKEVSKLIGKTLVLTTLTMVFKG